MESFVLVVHVIIASVMILFILMQQGKGAEAGASFGGGGSQLDVHEPLVTVKFEE